LTQLCRNASKDRIVFAHAAQRQWKSRTRSKLSNNAIKSTWYAQIEKTTSSSLNEPVGGTQRASRNQLRKSSASSPKNEWVARRERFRSKPLMHSTSRHHFWSCRDRSNRCSDRENCQRNDGKQFEIHDSIQSSDGALT
jgi:hypothetical protein